jgi:hypothetical protein
MVHANLISCGIFLSLDQITVGFDSFISDGPLQYISVNPDINFLETIRVDRESFSHNRCLAIGGFIRFSGKQAPL